MHPFFSVIIPVYNVAPYLRECLDSVLAQTFADWEAICVDDGSTDGSGTILDEYGRKDERFKILHISNGGVSSARNIGLDTARGTYVTFLDGDDLILPAWLESFFEVIKATDADLVRQKEKTFSGNYNLKLCSPCNGEIAHYDDAKVLKWGFETYCYEGWSWLNAIRINCIRKNKPLKFPDGMRFMEDNIFMLDVVSKVESAAQTNYHGYLYRQHSGSVCAHVRESEMIVRFLYEVAKHIPQSSLPKICQIHVGEMLARAIVDWRKNRDRSDRRGEKLVLEYVCKAVRSSMIRTKDVSPKWRIGIYGVCAFRSWLLLDIMLLVQRGWGVILRIAK